MPSGNESYVEIYKDEALNDLLLYEEPNLLSDIYLRFFGVNVDDKTPLYLDKQNVLSLHIALITWGEKEFVTLEAGGMEYKRKVVDKEYIHHKDYNTVFIKNPNDEIKVGEFYTDEHLTFYEIVKIDENDPDRVYAITPFSDMSEARNFTIFKLVDVQNIDKFYLKRKFSKADMDFRDSFVEVEFNIAVAFDAPPTPAGV